MIYYFPSHRLRNEKSADQDLTYLARVLGMCNGGCVTRVLPIIIGYFYLSINESEV